MCFPNCSKGILMDQKQKGRNNPCVPTKGIQNVETVSPGRSFSFLLCVKKISIILHSKALVDFTLEHERRSIMAP